MKDTKVGASPIDAGKEFHNWIVRGNKINLKESVDIGYCLYLFVYADLVLDAPFVEYSSAGMSIKS